MGHHERNFTGRAEFKHFKILFKRFCKFLDEFSPLIPEVSSLFFRLSKGKKLFLYKGRGPIISYKPWKKELYTLHDTLIANIRKRNSKV